jgi:three-Cys-motif partner protein
MLVDGEIWHAIRYYLAMNSAQVNQDLLDDGLITPKIGPWGEDKYFLVSNYGRIFASSMKTKWHCRVYIDLFAGAGRSKIAGTSRIVPASPLLALEIPDKFDRYILCEKSEGKMRALKQRVQTNYPDIDVHYIHGDSNLLVNNILSKIPKAQKDFKVLTFCFADPYSMKSLQFSTIQQLSERFMDFLILIPSGMDANRNLQPYYLNPNNKTIDNFLGTSEWREEWQKVALIKSFDVFLTNMYGKNMQELEYDYPGIQNTQLIRSLDKNLPLYRLAFFSRHKLGGRFWRGTKKYCDPQLKLFE